MEHILTMLMHKILQNHLLCTFVAILKIDFIQKVFATKILLSGKFSLFVTLPAAFLCFRESSSTYLNWKWHQYSCLSRECLQQYSFLTWECHHQHSVLTWECQYPLQESRPLSSPRPTHSSPELDHHHHHLHYSLKNPDRIKSSILGEGQCVNIPELDHHHHHLHQSPQHHKAKKTSSWLGGAKT